MVPQRLKLPTFALFTLLFITFIGSTLYKVRSPDLEQLPIGIQWNDESRDDESTLPFENEGTVSDEQPAQASTGDLSFDDKVLDEHTKHDKDQYSEDVTEYREIFSIDTWDRKFVPIFYKGANVINPNIIPHPTASHLWIIVAQHEQGHENVSTEEDIICSAVFHQGTLLCITPPAALPVPPSLQGNCDGESPELISRSGPRNARVFYGPDVPYVMYSSQSQHGCLGVWIQDARQLLDVFSFQSFVEPQTFIGATEIRRPGPLRPVEMDFFLFWDSDGQAYTHYDLFPQRVFAKLEPDGGVGEDLSPVVAASDQICYAKYMPHLTFEQESIQQATNSLSITLCTRADPECIPGDSNTFIMHIFHTKSVHDGRAIFEPYVVLFERTAPFAVQSISQRPIWIHGRKVLGSTDRPNVRTQRFYVNSMNWKSHTQRYHGYTDDILFLGFGIEDSAPGALDVAAGDLLQDLAFC
jgi:hypothetical protein